MVLLGKNLLLKLAYEILPCHRVVGASGSLTGFGGGLGSKRLLLALESGGSGRENDGQ